MTVPASPDAGHREIRGETMTTTGIVTALVIGVAIVAGTHRRRGVRR